MRNISEAPPVVPDHRVIHVVLDDFGKHGRAIREADENFTNFDDVVENILSGQYENPQRIFAFDPDEGWARDVTAEVATEVRRRIESGSVGSRARTFLERTM